MFLRRNRHDTLHLEAFPREQNLNSYFFLNFYQLKTEGSPPFSFHIFRKRSSVFVVLLLLLLFSVWNIFSGFHKCVYIYSFLRSLFIVWGKSSEDLDFVTLKFTWRIPFICSEFSIVTPFKVRGDWFSPVPSKIQPCDPPTSYDSPHLLPTRNKDWSLTLILCKA